MVRKSPVTTTALGELGQCHEPKDGPAGRRVDGLQLKADDFSGTVITASGSVRAARVALDTVAVAGTRVDQVEALVVERGLPHSLLGMSYLGRLSSFSATPTELTLRP